MHGYIWFFLRLMMLLLNQDAISTLFASHKLPVQILIISFTLRDMVREILMKVLASATEECLLHLVKQPFMGAAANKVMPYDKRDLPLYWVVELL